MNNTYFNWKQQQEPQQPTITQPRGEMGLTSTIPAEVVSPLVRSKETGDKVYLVKDGLAHWITNPEVLKAVGGDFGMIQTIDRSIFRQLRIAEKITLENAEQYKIPAGTQDQSKVSPPFSTPESTVSPAEPPDQDRFPNGTSRESTKTFTKYNEADPLEAPESAPGPEPEKGLTSIIIPVAWIHYPAFHYTGNCIGSIREHTDKEKTPYEIILVINGKTGINADRLELTYADKVIQLEENMGFAKAVNKGIRVAKGEYVAVVNNDVQVFDHWLEDFIGAVNNGLDLVMATPMYGMPFARAVEANALRYDHTPADLSDFKDFSCVLTRKELFNKIGLFNEEFFMYGEDIDLMRRMDKEGLKYASTKRVNTSHIIGATSSGIDNMPEIMNESKAKLKEIWGY